MRYQNISKTELTIPGVGVIAPGGFFATDIDINNVNIKKIEKPGTKEPETPNDLSDKK